MSETDRRCGVGSEELVMRCSKGIANLAGSLESPFGRVNPAALVSPRRQIARISSVIAGSLSLLYQTQATKSASSTHFYRMTIIIYEELTMGDIIRFIAKSERERIRLIREARAIYDSVFPTTAPVIEQRSEALAGHATRGVTVNHGNS